MKKSKNVVSLYTAFRARVTVYGEDSDLEPVDLPLVSCQALTFKNIKHQDVNT